MNVGIVAALQRRRHMNPQVYREALARHLVNTPATQRYQQGMQFIRRVGLHRTLPILVTPSLPIIFPLVLHPLSRGKYARSVCPHRKIREM